MQCCNCQALFQNLASPPPPPDPQSPSSSTHTPCSSLYLSHLSLSWILNFLPFDISSWSRDVAAATAAVFVHWASQKSAVTSSATIVTYPCHLKGSNGQPHNAKGEYMHSFHCHWLSMPHNAVYWKMSYCRNFAYNTAPKSSRTKQFSPGIWKHLSSCFQDCLRNYPDSRVACGVQYWLAVESVYCCKGTSQRSVRTSYPPQWRTGLLGELPVLGYPHL